MSRIESSLRCSAQIKSLPEFVRAEYVAAADRIAELEAECARLREERDALRDSLKRHQDGRCFANVHTRQVARAIEQEADAALRGKE